MKREGMPTQRLEEKGVEEHMGEGEREKKSLRMQERKRERETECFGSSFYMFSSTWACPKNWASHLLRGECYVGRIGKLSPKWWWLKNKEGHRKVRGPE